MNPPKALLIFILLLFTAGHLAAQSADPVAISRTTINEVVEDMLQNEAVYRADKSKLDAMVQRRLLPRFDFNSMTQLAVGQFWRQASPAQKKTLVDEFRKLLVRTYTNVLFSNIDQVYAYRDASFVVDSSRTMPNGDVVVEVKISGRGKDPVLISLRLRSKANDWKVIDVSANGVSLVVTYRTTFAREANQTGLDGLIKSLLDKNRSNG